MTFVNLLVEDLPFLVGTLTSSQCTLIKCTLVDNGIVGIVASGSPVRVESSTLAVVGG